MMVCVRLIIGEGERGGDKRSVDRLIQKNLDGREGTAILGTQRGRECPWAAERRYDRSGPWEGFRGSAGEGQLR